MNGSKTLGRTDHTTCCEESLKQICNKLLVLSRHKIGPQQCTHLHPRKSLEHKSTSCNKFRSLFYELKLKHFKKFRFSPCKLIAGYEFAICKKYSNYLFQVFSKCTSYVKNFEELHFFKSYKLINLNHQALFSFLVVYIKQFQHL